MRHNFKTWVTRATGMLALLALASVGGATEVRRDVFYKAVSFVDSAATGREVLSWLHAGFAYRGHAYVSARGFDDGQFELIYDFQWGEDGDTKVGFYFGSAGNIYRVEPLATNAGLLNRPFALANFSIWALGNGLIEVYRDRLTERRRQQLQELVKQADAKGLLEFSLEMRQLVH